MEPLKEITESWVYMVHPDSGQLIELGSPESEIELFTPGIYLCVRVNDLGPQSPEIIDLTEHDWC